jgi:hypothetical protein
VSLLHWHVAVAGFKKLTNCHSHGVDTPQLDVDYYRLFDAGPFGPSAYDIVVDDADLPNDVNIEWKIPKSLVSFGMGFPFDVYFSGDEDLYPSFYDDEDDWEFF